MRHQIIIFLFSIHILFAQTKPKIEELRVKYPNADVVTLNLTENINIEIKDDKLEISSDLTQENLFMTNKVTLGGLSDRRINYSPYFQDIINIEAATYVPDGKGFKKINVKDITTEKAKSSGIFYDDYMVKKVTFLGLQEGSIAALKYREIIKDPHMLGGFAFGNYISTENYEFTVSFPADVKVSYRTYGDFSKVSFKETKSRNKTTFTWKAQQIEGVPYESKSLNISYHIPQVQLFIEQYTINNKTTKVLSDENQLFDYYVSLVKDINQKPNAELKSLTDSLTKNKTEIEKIKSVYYWVQDHVKYVAFEDGMGGFIPREANDIFRKRFGDCKDMASIITTMLRLAGIKEAYLGWIGTRSIPFKYHENPSLSTDNHMIAIVRYNGEWQFLDATDDRIDFGLPTSHIQGKECMVMLSEKEYKILKVPIIEAEKNKRTDVVEVEIADKNIKGKGYSSLDGLWKTDVKYYLSNYTEKQKEEYCENMFRVGNNKCKVTNISIEALKERDKSLAFNYNFSIPDFVKNIDSELYINPHLFKPLSVDNLIEQTRKNELVNDFAWLEETIINIKIPENYEVNYLPKSISYKQQPSFGFELNYEQSNGKIILRQKTYVNNLIVKKEEFNDWNAMISKMVAAHNELIGFKKKT